MGIATVIELERWFDKVDDLVDLRNLALALQDQLRLEQDMYSVFLLQQLLDTVCDKLMREYQAELTE